MPNYTVLGGTIRHDGTRYQPGESIEMDKEQAEGLLARGRIKPRGRGRPPKSATPSSPSALPADDEG
ncbi:MAG: hypothetical protein B7733_07100 [Myxococcales bacterium FL481]|nr:MAG: hypothetical protein B7733_07100 [Myxococcales bacterium FL481]